MFRDLRTSDQKLLQGVAIRMLKFITTFLYPSDHEELTKALFGKQIESHLVKDLASASRKQHCRSQERRVINTLLASNVNVDTMYKLLHEIRKNHLKRGADYPKNMRLYKDEEANVEYECETTEEDDAGEGSRKRIRLNGGFARSVTAARKSGLQ